MLTGLLVSKRPMERNQAGSPRALPIFRSAHALLQTIPGFIDPYTATIDPSASR